MKTYPLALFLIIPVHLFSQCILNIGSADENCLGNNPALLELVLENSGDNLNWSYSSSPEGLNATISEFSFINSALIEFNQEGVYTITVTDGQNCNKTFEYSVYEPIGFETNINQSEYLLCNNETELQFEIIGNVVNQSWYSTYNSNGQVVISTSTNYEITFQEEAQFTLTVEADDENGCRSRVEQEISVTEGPSIENTTIQITNNSNDCVLNSTDYLLEFDVFSQLTENPTAIINFTPSQYNVVTTNNTETNAETFPINFEIEFENDCIIETTFEYSHNVYSKPEFEIDLNGTLCNEQAITLTNTSPNFNENTEDFFSWEIEGVDNLNGETITFNYEEDGMYTWVLNYNDPNGCSGQFDTTIAVNIESINAGFELTGPSVICEDTGNISFENTSSSNNGNLNYLWSIDNGNTALLSSTQENPNFELYVGSWNLELIVSSVNCADTLTSENVITLIDQPKFEVDFDGVLCNQEVITLSNTSANYNENTAEFFSWNIEGVENLNGETISFSYDQDGEYTWVLEYNNPNGCSAQYDTTVNVNVDYINPVLSTENNQLSCSLNTTLDLAHQTQLGADPLDLYEFEWNLTPNSLEYDASSNLTSSAENATFIISSTQAQNYSLSLEIVNVNTSCSGVKTVANYFSLGGIIADITPNTIKLCETENLSLNTSSIVQAEQVNQYNYNWTLRYLDGTPEIIEVSNLFNSTFILEELGLYQITLEISDENCSSGELSANAMVYPKPVIEATILDTTICTLPYQTNYAVNNNSPEFGSDIYQWNLYSNNDLLYEIENAENLNFSYIIEESNAYQLDLIVINETSLCSSSQSIELNVESVNNEIFSQDTTSCSSSTIVNVSTNNTELFIQNYDWIFTDNQGETTNVNNQQEVFINLEPGVYDVNLQTETYNGCQSSVSKTDYLTINSFDAVINQIPDSICFQGNNETTQTFTSSINSELNTAYELVNYSWEITSSSSQAPLKLSSDFENVQYQFYLPGVYTITFSAEIFGSGGNCSVLAQDEFNVGVDASIQFEDQICLGETFSIEAIELDLWSQTHDFNWQTDQPNSITIDNPNNLTAQISTDLTEQVLDSIVNITLTTTNNVGCWQTKSKEIEIYKIDANFEVSDSILHCSDQQITLNSTNNQYIDSWEWTIYEPNNNFTTYQDYSDEFQNHSFNNAGYSSIELNITSKHGCIDQFVQDSVVLLNGYNVEILSDSIFCLNDQAEIENTFYAQITPLFPIDSIASLFQANWNISPTNGTVLNSFENNIDSVSYLFNQSNSYDLFYNISFENQNCEIQKNFNIDIGVSVAIQDPITICVGNEHTVNSEVDTWSENHAYEWYTSSSELQITNPTSSSVSIETFNEIETGEITNYDLSLIVTNDANCIDTVTSIVQAYQVKADMLIADTLLNCTDQNVLLSSLNNQYINSWNWIINEPNQPEENVSLTDSTYTHTFSNPGVSLINLEISSVHGCSDQTLHADTLFLNTFEVLIDEVPDSICFQGALQTTQVFNATITSNTLGLPYESTNFNWEIISNNSSSASLLNQSLNQAEFEFTNSGVYTLVYWTTINGTDLSSDCLYSDTVVFNVGVDVSIMYDEIICVGKQFNAQAVDLDPWSQSHLFNWSTDQNELLIQNPNENETTLSTETELGANNSEIFDISLQVTNTVGCWEIETETIEAYQVVADMLIADTLLFCPNQSVQLSSLNNQYINSWNWIINEPNQPEENVSLTDSTYTHTFSNPGVSLINLEISSVHGCSDQTLHADTLFLNTFEVLIDEVPDSICFQGALQTTQVFNATITSNTLGLPYESTNFNWEIISNNSSSASLLNQSLNQAEFEFTNSGVYTLVYWTTINGTDLSSDCLYSDTVVFNVGVDVSIMYDEIICVGKQFNAQAVDLDPWSQSHLFNWSTDQNELLIQNPNENETTLSTETELGANNSEIFDISLQVTNTVGCWEIETETIEAYQVVADMLIADTLLFCPNQSVQLSSLNNQYINSWSWTSTEENYNFNEPLISSLVGQQSSLNLNSVGIYDVSLVVSSSHGCSDSISIDSAIVINDLNPVLLDIDSILCFNGATELDKQFQINYNSIYEVPITISEFEWNTSPEVEIIEENSIGLSVKFNEPNNYSISYTIEIDNGTANSCFYSDEIEFDIGVNASIDIPETICVGNSFEMSAEVSIGIGDQTTYNWLADSYTFIAYPNATQTNITSESDFLTGDQISNHPIEFTVVNDNGCFIKIQDSIKVYNIVADIISDETGELCAPVQLAFESLYTNYVESYQWGYYKEDYFGDDEYYLSTLDTSIFVLQANDMAIYDIGLSVLSEHGCVDTIFYNDLISVKKPYPNFSTNNNSICDGELLDINDESSLTTNVFLTYGTVYIDSLLYNVNETNQIQMSFPYGETEELVYSEKVTLYGFLDECTSSFYDTVQIYPNPNIKIEYSDTAGCSPHQIDFSDFTTYILPDSATYFWDFGDGVTSEAKNPQHTYTIPGLYQVFHSVTSKNGCYSDTLISTLFEIYENPTASLSFTITNDAFCYGQAEVQFENTSTYTTDSILSSWTFNLDTNSNYTDFEPSIVFNASGEVEINLEVTDLRGCFDDTIALINIDILDTLVNLPLIKYVTVNELGVQVVWGEETQDDYFKNIILAHKENQDWVQIFNSSDEFLNTYNHTISTSQINNYVILQQDSCTYYSDSSIMHSTIHLTVESNEYETLELTWSNYKGWEEVDYYSIYKSTNNLEFDEIDTVENTTLSYIDTGLCNIDYYYYVMAHHPDSLFESKSNTVDLEPKFIDFEIPISLSKTSVFRLNPSEFSPNNELIVTDWDYIYQSNLSFYNIDRWDNYFGWIENYALTSNPPFVDYNVKPPLQKYYYRVSYGDVCGNSGPQSNIGSNIILNGVNKENQFHLNWDSYSDWPGGIDSYTIQFFNSNFQAFTDIGVVSSDTYDYIDRELIEENRDSVFCFRVVASSFLNTNVKSNSNSLCLNPSPENFSPNAFTPNNDGINDFFEFYGSYPKSIRVKISNRWGQTVYESDQINFKWDGTNIQSGLNCPQDSYTVDFIIEGYDESVHKTRKSLTLIR